MGKLVGLPEWLAVTLFLILAFAAVMIWSTISFRRSFRRLAAHRPSPSRDEFLELLSNDVDADVAVWMWNTLEGYYQLITPHPEDHLLRDARIDDDDVTMDWLPAFAKQQELRWQYWSDWPEDWELTVRNFARWLQLGRDTLQR